MAHLLTLGDGVTTVDFLGSSGTSWCLLEDGGLVIETPRVKEDWSGGSLPGIGKILTGVGYENRNISLVFEIVGDDRDAIIAKQTTIVNLLNSARRSQMFPYAVPSVYLKYKIDTMTYPVYFDILSGTLSVPENIMSLESLNWKKGAQYTIKGFQLDLICKPLGRGDPVLVVDGGVCENTTDSLYQNYIDITGSNIPGDVSSPAIIRVSEGTYGDNRVVYWTGVRAVGGTFTSDFISGLEAEDGTYYGTLTSQSTSFSGDSGDTNGGYAVEYDTEIDGVRNGDLEDNNGTDTFDEWISIETSGTVDVEGTIVHGGSYAAKLTAGLTSNAYIYQQIHVDPSTDYTLSFYTRGDGTYAGRYEVYDVDTYSNIVSVTSTGVTGTSYTLVEVNFTTPELCELIRIYMYCPPSLGGIAYFDDISISGTISPWGRTVVSWTLPLGAVPKYKGPVRALAIGSFSTDCKYRMRYYYGGWKRLYLSWDWVRPEFDYHATRNYVMDLGVIDLVPWDVDYSELTNTRDFYFDVMPDDPTVSSDVRLDVILFIPAEDFKYRSYKSPDNVGAGRVEDNGYKDIVRYYSGTGYYRHAWDQYGLPIYLEPGVNSRFYILAVYIDGTEKLWVPALDHDVDIYVVPLYYNIIGD